MRLLCSPFTIPMKQEVPVTLVTISLLLFVFVAKPLLIILHPLDKWSFRRIRGGSLRLFTLICECN